VVLLSLLYTKEKGGLITKIYRSGRADESPTLLYCFLSLGILVDQKALLPNIVPSHHVAAATYACRYALSCPATSPWLPFGSRSGWAAVSYRTNDARSFVSFLEWSFWLSPISEHICWHINSVLSMELHAYVSLLFHTFRNGHRYDHQTSSSRGVRHNSRLLGRAGRSL
jgi:hypothetical protein